MVYSKTFWFRTEAEAERFEPQINEFRKEGGLTAFTKNVDLAPKELEESE